MYLMVFWLKPTTGKDCAKVVMSFLRSTSPAGQVAGLDWSMLQVRKRVNKQDEWRWVVYGRLPNEEPCRLLLRERAICVLHASYTKLRM